MSLSVYRPHLGTTAVCAMVVGLRARNLRGFIFLWTRIMAFVRETRIAGGCRGVYPGIRSWRSLILVSYWQDRESLQAFARAPTHVAWMRYIARNPDSLDLFNETYAQPVSLNTVNTRGGFAAAVEKENSK